MTVKRAFRRTVMACLALHSVGAGLVVLDIWHPPIEFFVSLCLTVSATGFVLGTYIAEWLEL